MKKQISLVNIKIPDLNKDPKETISQTYINSDTNQYKNNRLKSI